MDFTALTTGYHPVSQDDPNYQMEGGFEDKAGDPVYTLDQYRRGEAPYVTVAMDASAVPHGTTLVSPDFPDIPFQVRDTGAAFKGKGLSRVDIARDSASGANSDEVNRQTRFEVVPSGGIAAQSRGGAAQPLASAGINALPISPAAMKGPLQYAQMLVDDPEGDGATGDVLSQASTETPNEEDTSENIPRNTNQPQKDDLYYPPHPHHGVTVVDKAKDGSWAKLSNGTVIDYLQHSVTYLDPDGVTKWKQFDGQPPHRLAAPPAPVIKTDQRTGRQYNMADPDHPKEVIFPPNPDDLKQGVTGEAALEGLPEGKKNQVKALTGYTMNINAIPTRGHERDEILGRAFAYDPSFDMSHYIPRQKVIQSFTSGTDSQNNSRLNTVVQHIDELAKASEALHNKSGFLAHPINAITNVGKNIQGDPAVTKFDLSANAVSNELAAVFKGSNDASIDAVRSWKASISKAQSPEQLRMAVDEAIRLMAGRLDAQKQKYLEGVGKPLDYDLLTPNSKKILSRLGHHELAGDEDNTEPNVHTGTVPVPTNIQIGEKVYSNPDGTGPAAYYTGANPLDRNDRANWSQTPIKSP